MRLLILAGFLVFTLFGITSADNWFTENSEHFTINYQNAEDKFIGKVLDMAEIYYDEIAEELGFRRYDFWLGDNRAQIYVYDDAESYQKATGLPSWSEGAALYKDKTIHTFPAKRGFFDRILPHEMSHLIFREFVGFNNYAVPIWLDEGISSYHDKSGRAQAKKIVQDSIKKETFISIETLANLSPLSMKNRDEVNLFYAESTSLVDYLLSEFGRDSFVIFCQELRNKKNFESALRYAYPFNDIFDLEEGWRHYLR